MADTNNSVEFDIPLTQRAYTLRLTGNDSEGWRDALWKTHEAVNRGAQRFGDWLLTLRGGISHELAEKLPAKLQAADSQEHRAAIRDRRILLALSWLSVESGYRGPKNNVTSDPVGELRSILQNRGLEPAEVEQWVDDCKESLRAKIKDEAVWVNRSAAFDAFTSRYAVSRRDVEDLIFSLVLKEQDYLAPIIEDEASDATDDEQLAASSNVARGWISTNFGTGEKNDNSAIAENLRSISKSPLESYRGRPGLALLEDIATRLGVQPQGNVLDAVRIAVGWKTGRFSAGRMALERVASVEALSAEDIETLKAKLSSEARSKSSKAGALAWAGKWQADLEADLGIRYVTGRNLVGEFSSMLDHAIRKVRSAHTWIRRAEGRRRSFSKEKQRIQLVPTEARAFLDDYCEWRTADSGAADRYRIRKRAIDGWNEVVEAWSGLGSELRKDDSGGPSVAAQAREAKIHELQGEVEKFGDAQLFEELANSDAICVWKRDGKPDAAILLDYVHGRLAEHNMTRFKVPAYCHPDPLMHPVFCDFGNSRWNIEYAVHRSRGKLAALRRSLEKKEADAAALRARLSQCERSRRASVDAKLNDLDRAIAELKTQLSWLGSPGALRMGLWDGSAITNFDLQWRCNRLTGDLGTPTAESIIDVPRADRFGRAVAGAGPGVDVLPVALFDEEKWSGRLQAPRDQLRRIAGLEQRGGISEEDRAHKIAQAKAHLKWLITLSAKLKPRGPWIDYAAAQGLNYRALPHKVENSKRKGSAAKLAFSRLPGLRVLSVDLGHRYGASCAVWQALSAQEFDDNTAQAKAMGKNVEISDMYAVVSWTEDEGKPRRTIYRRIAADKLDSRPHPAAWARLARQFVVKLQGEDEEARAASRDESARVQRFCKNIGRKLDIESRDVSELMAGTVRFARLGLRRHADIARIAIAMTQQCRWTRGEAVRLSDQEYKDEISRALQRWFNLATAENWQADAAQRLWKECQEAYGLHLPNLGRIEPDERKKRAIRDTVLAQAAEELVACPDIRLQIGECFARLWHEAEPQWANDIRWLRHWVLPSGDNPANRHTGGLSLKRIGTIQDLYRLQKAHYQRLTPQGPQMRDGKPVTASENFFRRAQENVERMRDNRVKQLASRIVEAALGLGNESPRRAANGSNFGHDRRRAAVLPDDPRFAPCHVIVTENLRSYRANQSRTRRENRGLMGWSSAQVFKYLSDACTLYGFRVYEVSPHYTSQQDSRSGLPGIRCMDVNVRDFVAGGYWKRRVAKAGKRCDEGKGSQRDRFLVELITANWNEEEKIWTEPDGTRWQLTSRAGTDEFNWHALTPLAASNQQHEPHPVRVPQQGGDIFVCSAHGPTRGGLLGLQADMNAAANIGLRAVTDPDWPGRWWYVLCDGQHVPDPKKIQGSAAFDRVRVLRVEDAVETSGKAMNLWRKPTSRPLQDDRWLTYQVYWDRVEQDVIELLRRQIFTKAKAAIGN